ncbi:MAG: thioredoxin family protein [Methylocystis sp.]|uniref:thioredoxin family protein n=1 Tax=Methylocystis sp. TaxID=1911079 RepID=UPI003D0B9852
MISRRRFAAIACAFGAAVLAGAPAFAASQNFTQEAFAAAQKAGKPIIVHVYAPWCPTCRAQEPIMQRVESDPAYAGVDMFRVDFDSQKNALRALKANRQSTIIVFKDGKEVGRSVGATDPGAISALVSKAL